MDKKRNNPSSLGGYLQRGVGPQEKVHDKEAKKPAIFNQKAYRLSYKSASLVSLDLDSLNINPLTLALVLKAFGKIEMSTLKGGINLLGKRLQG